MKLYMNSALCFPTASLRIKSTLTMLGMMTLGLTAFPEGDGSERRREPQLPSPICDRVNVPEGNRLTVQVYAKGVQIYRWNGTAWVFIAPEATLFADPCHEHSVGIHYAGPTWESEDGSKVMGSRIDGCTPERGAIPWLLLKGSSTSNRGDFSRVTFIQRLNTLGGTAPSEAGTFLGDEARVPYTTEYFFYRAEKR